jgi:hypothetical protein
MRIYVPVVGVSRRDIKRRKRVGVQMVAGYTDLRVALYALARKLFQRSHRPATILWLVELSTVLRKVDSPIEPWCCGYGCIVGRYLPTEEDIHVVKAEYQMTTAPLFRNLMKTMGFAKHYGTTRLISAVSLPAGVQLQKAFYEHYLKPMSQPSTIPTLPVLSEVLQKEDDEVVRPCRWSFEQKHQTLQVHVRLQDLRK